jgi:predicted nucleotide-binding protein
MSKPALPTLLVSRPEAEEKIKQQIQKARQILAPLTSAGSGFGFSLDAALEKAKVEQEKWAKFTIDLLKSFFDNISISEEFGDWWIHYADHRDMVEQLVKWMNDRIGRLESMLDRLPLFPVAETKSEPKIIQSRATFRSKEIFIVHGHDEAAKHEVARFIENLGLRAVILHEQADMGRTIIEKFEDHSDVGFAVILLTPDDIGGSQDQAAKHRSRARQNVIFELGFFVGKLGRRKVCALRKGDIEIPTDYLGVLYVPMDENGAWKLQLSKEIKQAGIEVDLNRAI